MKPITLTQWKNMTPKKRSWVVARALGERARIFWHCTRPNGETVGGSYQSKQRCDWLIRAAKELTSEEAQKIGVPFPHPMADAQALPTASFAHYACYDHVAIREGIDLLKETGSFSLRVNRKSITASSGKNSAKGGTLEEAVCLLILTRSGFIRPEVTADLL